MPFLTTTPIRINSPICAIRLNGVRVAASSHAAPVTENGIEKRIANGCASDSKSDAITI